MSMWMPTWCTYVDEVSLSIKETEIVCISIKAESEAFQLCFLSHSRPQPACLLGSGPQLRLCVEDKLSRMRESLL